jgi:uncharacterized membrane protein
MGFTGRALLITGLLLEALLFAGVAYAQIPPVPTPAPQPQTIVGRELAAGAQILTDASNNVNAIVLLVIAVCVVLVILGVVMVIVLRAILDAQRRADARQETRDRIDQENLRRRDATKADMVDTFSHAVNTFSVVTAGVAQIKTDIEAMKTDQTESKRRTQERDRLYFERIDTVENRIVGSMSHGWDRLAHEIPQALRDGQAQAAQLLIDNLPTILAQAALAQSQAQAITPPPDAVDKIEIHAENVEVNTKDKGETL